jgi:uncharacterized membrane protein
LGGHRRNCTVQRQFIGLAGGVPAETAANTGALIRRGEAMSDLVVISYAGRDTAEKVLDELKLLQKEYLVDLEDVCIVTRDPQGKLQLKQAVNLVTTGAIGGGTWGALWGVLIGVLFMNPLAGLLAGAAAGAGAGALGGAMADYGINDDFIKHMGESITQDCSALFVLFRKVTFDRVLPELEKFGGTVLRTSLTQEQETALREALSKHIAAAQA